MYTVREILQSKDSKLWTIKTDASVFEALELMAEKNIGSLLVMKNKKMQGIFSERDYARGIVLKGKSSKKTSVGELMTKNVIYVAPDGQNKGMHGSNDIKACSPPASLSRRGINRNCEYRRSCQTDNIRPGIYYKGTGEIYNWQLLDQSVNIGCRLISWSWCQ